MTSAKAFAPAKINLTLHVTGQRADGYHLLDSLVMFADFGDRITVQLAPQTRLNVDGPMAAGVPDDGRNLVVQAADFIGVTADIRLQKHLPAAAGIGGGSSDAAATLRALRDLSGKVIPGDTLPLGADVPVCMVARCSRMRGIGEQVETLPDTPPLAVVLVNPRVDLPTPTVFQHLRDKSNPSMPESLPHWRGTAEFIAWLATQRNDLQAAALSLSPAVGETLAALSALPDCQLARMSGSGATCFGVFPTLSAAQAAAASLTQTHPNWWVQPCTLT
ncbi:MAG: 4-diphosphocytidyl-2-C-methyl-D-erythritol kinase [Paracoccaceae bacterium]|jgi:4-diphosphocytidyl-2-C-methyl-D-erythritol kinase